MKYSKNSFFSDNIFSNKKILILAPHEDDEINIAGDLPSVFISNNCEVYFVFSTNGDYFPNISADVRIKEALKSADYFGVPRDNVYFLGYGDRWNTEYGHLYNAPDMQLLVSHIGKTKTYGGKYCEDYHYKKYGNHADYSKSSFFGDLYDVINDIKADVIFTIDYDTHPDHIALSSTFEEVIHKLILEQNYRPLVLKTFAYDTCFYGIRDYSSLNPQPTLQPTAACEDSNSTEESVFPSYQWNRRLRVPMCNNTLTNNIFNSYLYKALKCHKSQLDARHFAGRIINSDKVFWERRTDSILYTSNISVTSGNGSYLTDFKIVDSDNILAFEDKQSRSFFNNCSWIPDEMDTDRCCRFELKNPETISQIVIYENPSPDSYINSVSVSFDNGFSQTFELSYHDGSANYLSFPEQSNINNICIKILSYSGKNPGLSEVEAYSTLDTSSLSSELVVKITANGNFVYDYYQTKDLSDIFSVYTYPLKTLTKDDYIVTTDNNNAIINFISDSTFVIKGTHKKCTLTVRLSDNPNVYDQILLQKTGTLKKLFVILVKHTESILWLKYRIISKIKRLFT